MPPPGTDEPNPFGTPPPRRRPPRQMDMDKLYDTLQQAPATLDKLRTNSIGAKLALIPAGSFAMGSGTTELQRRSNEGPTHEITFAAPIYLSVHVVTQEQYQKIMGKNPARFHRENGGGLDHPVENVSWEDAVNFCLRLASMPTEKAAGLTYRLPTEAEWEYAGRAGTTTSFSFGGSLAVSQANIDGNTGSSLQRTSRVGAYPANNFGLFDMHGNVWEWCADWYDADYYAKSVSRDPQGPADGSMRVVRGGSWRNQAATCRSAYRNALVPHNRDAYTGFRIAARPLGA